MSTDHTQHQSSDEQRRSQLLSKQAPQPPRTVPGYQLLRPLGSGAYGEVWVALDQTTGRRVAIKFYAHRGGLDWSLLSREVEKLAFLSADRYVVQLLDVGWEADPPYYVMEYVEQGSLEDRLKREGPLPIDDAVSLFHDIAIGLLHAHAKGVLHCDLKPGNVLLDQDHKPRLADFGQSRLSHDQTPALGTLFYMAPEQADLTAVPDVRWDVYALGALLYAMLTGAPPYRSEESITELDTATDLEQRLACYRALIAASDSPAAHCQRHGVDRALAEIIDRSLSVNRHQRYANVQSVLDALAERSRRRARLPLVLLGAIGPALVLLVMSFFTWQAFRTVVQQSDEALRARVLESNRFAAEFAAKTVASELDQRYRALETVAVSERVQQLYKRLLADPELAELRAKLSDPTLFLKQRESLHDEFLKNPLRLELQQCLDETFFDRQFPPAGSWFMTDAAGLQLARAPTSPTVGQNFGWRNYFTGDTADHPSSWRPGGEDHITKTHVSSVYRSESTNRWHVAITTPVFEDGQHDKFWGVVGTSVEVGQFVPLASGEDQYPLLIDWRPGVHQGLVLQHPLFDQVLRNEESLPDRFREYRLKPEDLPVGPVAENFVDPLSHDPDGEDFDRRWLAAMAPVKNREGDTGWILIVERSYRSAIGRTLGKLELSLWTNGLIAVAVVAIMSGVLWTIVGRALSGSTQSRRGQPQDSVNEVSLG
jgi:serine/threonine protein kinase